MLLLYLVDVFNYDTCCLLTLMSTGVCKSPSGLALDLASVSWIQILYKVQLSRWIRLRSWHLGLMDSNRPIRFQIETIIGTLRRFGFTVKFPHRGSASSKPFR